MPARRAGSAYSVLWLAVLCVGWSSPISASAAEEARQSEEAARAYAPGSILDSETRHTLSLDGERLEYTAKAGTLPVPEDDGGPARGEIFYVAYSHAAADPDRPITFVFNGGPGAAAAYLHMGAMGPKRVEFAPDGRVPAEDAALAENEATWLTFTDLVFVDPIGTGYSRTVSIDARSAAGGQTENGSDEASFWETGRDLDTLAEFIRLFLSRNQRWLSPIMLAGESYGGFRAAALADRLQSRAGISVEGVVLISPAIELGLLSRDPFRLLPWATRLPSLAAAAHRHSRARSGGPDLDQNAFLSAAERFAVTEVLPAMALGQAVRPEERRALLTRLAAFTGLPQDVVERYGPKLPPEVFATRLLEDEGRILSLYDASITYPAPHPASSRYRDPRLSRISAAIVTAFNHHVRANLGVDTDLPYEILNRRVNANWRWRESSSREGPPGAAGNLEEAFKKIENFRVLLVHGLYDLVTPYYGSVYLLNQLDLPPALRARITFRNYEGGHMFYSRQDSRKEFYQDARSFYSGIAEGPR